MKTLRRTLGVLRLPGPVPEFIEYVDLVIGKMTNNTYFQSPTPALATVQNANNVLKVDQVAAKTRAKGAVEARDAQVKVVTLFMQGLLMFVQQTADNSPSLAATIITSAGMFVRGETPHTKLPFAAKQGSVSGEVVLAVKSEGPRTTYWYAFSTDQKSWTVGAPVRVAKTTITGLTSATTYWFRYQTLTKIGLSDWSQPISLLVR